MLARVGMCLMFLTFWVGGCAARAVKGSATDVGGRAPAEAGEPEQKAPQASPCQDLAPETVTEELPSGVRVEKEGVWTEEGKFTLDGTTTHWWPSGTKKLELHFDCGVQHGPKAAWYQSGNRWNAGEYVDGKGNGTWIEWFDGGEESQQFVLDHGAWHGTQTAWHPNGQKRTEVEWVHGMRQGFLTFWGEDGNVEKRIEFVDGKPQPTPSR